MNLTIIFSARNMGKKTYGMALAKGKERNLFKRHEGH
jgi:hypothetical protein